MLRRVFIIVFALQGICGFAQTQATNYNSVTNYSFIVGGHFYGGAGNNSGYPASTLLANFNMINELDPLFVVCTGDLYKDVKNDKEKYEQAFSQLTPPVYNAVGNHDVSWSDPDQGVNYRAFSTSSTTHIILDSEVDDGHIEGEQFDFLKSELVKAAGTVFIYSHRPIWCEEDEELKHLFKGNTRNGTNYKSDLLPLLKESGKKIFWFSGSLGGNAPVSFFYHEFSADITYVNTAIRNIDRDALLLVNVQNNNLDFVPLSLTGQDLQPLETYNLDYWGSNEGNEDAFNFRLVPLYFKNMLTHRYFWYGAFWCVVGLGLLLFVVRRRKRKRGA